ncbi:hypothetical protein LSH36_584g01041 [Paralvinella palmiformis]|uniref:Sulfatase N-terminal domain-containing protein n=1 Tax=Paralvinella palmiformis TaxID=53620 RepID=A0AAD9J5Y4_9ANNE|nr:hypothetical protein LSH36_584g01041 [Paralvinella palmiformis]
MSLNTAPLAAVLLLLVCLVAPSRGSVTKRNVLFLVADDMRPEIGAYVSPDFPSPIHPKIHTPHLDSLAKKSLLLKRAYVQQALCSPSRTSLLTGRRPDTTRTHGLYHYFRKIAGNFTTIPQYFKENGYTALAMGKIFHPGHTSGGDDPISWSERNWQPDLSHWWKDMGVTWTMADDSEVVAHPLEDMQVAARAVNTLKALAKSEKPFFLAAGFRRPHLPFLCPKKFYDLYPKKAIRLPNNGFTPNLMPEVAWSYNAEMRQYSDLVDHRWYGEINVTLPDEKTLALRRAYYACTSYTDSLVGQVVDTLAELGLENNTVVAFWGDHGWNLGENAAWSKCTNFELATHAPMIIRVPGLTDSGVVTEGLTEFVDLFPTLAEAAGLEPVPLCPKNSESVQTCTEGISLLPLMSNPKRKWKSAAFSQYPRLCISGDVVMGYTMRTDRYRYTEWMLYDDARFKNLGVIHMNSVELYDHEKDPEENHNFAFDPEYKEIRQALHKQLEGGWRHALPDV